MSTETMSTETMSTITDSHRHDEPERHLTYERESSQHGTTAPWKARDWGSTRSGWSSKPIKREEPHTLGTNEGVGWARYPVRGNDRGPLTERHPCRPLGAPGRQTHPVISAIGSSYDALLEDLAAGCRRNRQHRQGKATSGSSMQIRSDLHRKVKIYCLLKNVTLVDLVENLLEAILIDDPFLSEDSAFVV